MAISKGSDAKKVYRGSTAISKVYRGELLKWSAELSPVFWAKFNRGEMTVNSGTSGGNFVVAGGAVEDRLLGGHFPSGVAMYQFAPLYPNGLTMMGWFKPSSAAVGVPLFLWDGGFSIGFGQNATGVFVEVKVANAVSAKPLVSRKIPTGDWIHLAATLRQEGSSWHVDLFIDGVLEKTESFTPAGAFALNKPEFQVAPTWQGTADELRYFSSPIPQEKVEEIYNLEAPTYGFVWPQEEDWAGGTVSFGTIVSADSYLVPRDGMYEVSWVLDVSSGTYVYSDIEISPYTYVSDLVSAPGQATATFSGPLYADQIINFRARKSGTGSGEVSGGHWSITRIGDLTIPELVNLNSAKSTKYRVAFAGSSTMQGWGQPRYESTAHILTARLVRHAQGANASKMVSQTSGTLAGPTLPGFHFLNAGLGGTTSLNYLDNTKRDLVNSYGPDLLIHMVGSNDYSEQIAPDTYKMRMRSALNSITGTVQHVLVQQQRREDRADTGYKWEEYGQALRELANEFSNVHFVDASQAWHDLRGNATDWWAADKIHVSYKGAQGLATAIANAMELDEHIGDTVWAIDAADGRGGNNNLVPTTDSLVSLPASAASANAVNFTTVSGKRQITFNNSGARYADTSSWNAAYSFPMTMFVVVESEPDGSNSTTVQPFFSRSVGSDDGWAWAWKEKNSNNFFAALNSAFSWSGSMPRDGRYVLGVQIMSNNWVNLYINSELPVAELAPNNVAAEFGPWIKSMRLGANSSAANYTDVLISEIRFENTGFETEQVSKRMRELGAKHSVGISGRDVHPLKVVNSKVWIPYTGGSSVNAGRDSKSLVIHRGGNIGYSNGYAYYDGRMDRMDSMGTATQMSMGCWYRRNSTRTGYNSFLQRAQLSDTNFRWEFYVGLDGNRAMMGGQINGYWFDLKDSVASVNDGQWHFINAFISQSSSKPSEWFAGLRVDGRDFFRTLTGRATTPFPSDPLLIGGDRKSVPMTGIYLDDVFCTDSELSLAMSQDIWKNWPPN